MDQLNQQDTDCDSARHRQPAQQPSHGNRIGEDETAAPPPEHPYHPGVPDIRDPTAPAAVGEPQRDGAAANYQVTDA